jgi:hypothetical protein
MSRRILVDCLAVIGVLVSISADAAAQPALDGKSKPNPGGEIYVIMKARLYEVDEAFHNKLAKAKWYSRADLEELDKPSATRAPADHSLFTALEKQKPVLVGKEINIDLGKEGVLLTATKAITCLPTPDQLRQGKKGQQKIEEVFTLSAQVQVSADRRFVHAKLLEKGLEIEGIEKVKILVDLNKGTEAAAEIVFVKETSTSQARYIADGGKFLFPLQSRPSAVRNKERWLVAEIAPRIYIEAEERALRGAK